MIALPTLKPIFKAPGGGTLVYRVPLVSMHANLANTATSYYSIGGGLSSSTTLAYCQSVCGTAGTLKNLRCDNFSNSSSTSTTVRVIKNGVATALTLTVGAGTTGVVENSSDSVSIAVNDLIAFEVVRGSAENISFTTISVDFLSATGTMIHVSSASNAGAKNTGAGTTRFARPNGLNGLGTTENITQNYAPCGFTAKNFAFYVSANTRVNNTTVRIMKNTGNSAISVIVAAGATGWFSSGSTESFAAGDLIGLSITNGASAGNIVVRTFCFETDPTVTGTTPIFMGYANITMTSADSPRNSALAGQQIDINGATSPGSRYRTIMKGAGTVKNLYCLSQGNAADVDTTYTLRSGGSSTGIVATLPAVTSGGFSDTTNTYAYSSGSSMDMEFARAGTGTHTIGSASVALEITQETL